ncbi:nucleoside deaminase [Marinobacterium mangrovicola]|uniref:tRNA(Arg) A34 adenosine deaminase TadA n=1 Tax=Marinobacterium mangrovicola TaxID=1476959 RepID=A0A4R1GJB6_9GAMM|nr:nucleoside deaminase [Marinobacterium mangrovicola]TCK08467.1 tRNA(Arg) A34 adenosine deaminase TadA [Marinobacterium mangrovicola]
MDVSDTLAAELRARFEALEPDLRFRDEAQAMHACELALHSLLAGTYGVGALLMDDRHRVWAESGNEVLSGRFDSAAHAEMRAFDQLEARENTPPSQTLSLLVTLEPCPMCLSRALYAGVGEIVYLVEDGEGGMAHLRDHLPPALKELAQLCHFRRADVSDPLRDLAESLSRAGLQAHREELMHKRAS